MTGDSKPVSSNQPFCHPNLHTVVRNRLSSGFRRPIAGHTRAAFEAVRPTVEERGLPLIFDSYCGSGMSTARLASLHPDKLIVGIDKSAHRLGKHRASASKNYLLVRADCGDFWRLAVAAGWRAAFHYLFYPNPWPKKNQLRRRLHGSPDFPDFLALGGAVELRSNWQVYVEEFGVALNLAGQLAWIDSPQPQESVSLFERKYLLSGHAIWRCRCKLGDNARVTRD